MTLHLYKSVLSRWTLGLHLRSNVQKLTRLMCSSSGNDELIIRSLDGDKKGIVTFLMNRPKTKNAIGRNVVTKLEEAIQVLRFDKSARVLVVGSEVKGAFCSGADLKERATMKVHEIGPYVARLRNLLRQLELLPIPVIAAMDGVALGGGLEMALACDMRIASNDAAMGLVETRIANVPGGGGTQRLSRAIGLARAKEMIFTAAVIGGCEAEKIGLVQQCVDQNDAGNAAFTAGIELAQRIIPNGPFAIKAAKTAIDRGIQVDLDTGLAIEELCYNTNIPTKDRLEGIAAFREKRAPIYTGE